MKPWLKAIIIIVVIAALAAGGIYIYARVAGNNPADVTPANYWTLSYMPNRSYIYGVVVSDESQSLYKESDRTVEEVFVREGDTVHIGDPLLRYDSTKDSLTLEEKLLEREKLYNTLQADYAEYKRWARVEYERAVPTYTPSPSPTPRTKTGASNLVTGDFGVVRLTSRRVYDLTSPLGGKGSALDPFRYTIADGEAIPAEFLRSFTQLAKDNMRTFFALLTAPKSEILIEANPDETISFAVTAEDPHPKSANFNEPLSGNGSEDRPFVFSYSSRLEVPSEFLKQMTMMAQARMESVFVQLLADGFSVSLKCHPEGGFAMYVTVIEPTPTPTPSPTPTPTPTPSPTPEAEETEEPTPYVPMYYGPSKAEREEYARQTAQKIRTEEVQYRQLELDIFKLQTSGANGVVYSTVEGTVTTAKDPAAAQNGELVLEVRGGTGLHLMSIVGEMDLAQYPVGTELTGFSYQAGQQVTVRVSEIGSMPITTSYQNGGNPNASGYLVRMDFIGDYEPELGEYIEFSDDFIPREEREMNYLHEAYIREIDGQDCIFLVRDDHIVKTPVKTGKRFDQYIELVDIVLTPDDYLAFPYDKNAKDGAPVNYPSEGGMLYW